MRHSPVRSLSLDLVSRWRWALAAVLGAALFFVSLVLSEVVPSVGLGLDLVGPTYALVGVLRAALGFLAVAASLLVVRRRPRDVGLVADRWRQDAAVGAAVAVGFALLQAIVLIPATGGAGRSDVVANAAQIGDTVGGVFGFVALAWTGAFAEELFFRGLFLTAVWGALGRSAGALAVAVVATTALFAAGHGYQGWAGVIDTGLYGGLSMSLLYLWRGRRLTAPIVAHALWNTLATIGIALWA